MSYRKKLIEVALPLVAINEASAREKSIRHGHPSTLHLWWARRPLAAARAILFGQLVDDPSAWPDLFPTEQAQAAERHRLFDVIEKLVTWENTTNEEVINAARLEIAKSHARSAGTPDAKAILAGKATVETVNRYLQSELPPVHDPFAGGGTIPLEAQRLGLRSIATDLNPVAVLINKALIDIPPRFAGRPPVNRSARASSDLRTWVGAAGLAEDIRFFGRWMQEQAKSRIGGLYPEANLPKELGGKAAHTIAWLWARTVASPDPTLKGVHVPLVSSFWLAMKDGKKAWIEPVVAKDRRSYKFEVRTGEPKAAEAVSAGTKLSGASFRCLLSGTPIGADYIRSEGRHRRMGTRLLAVVVEGNRSRVYLAPSEEAERIADSAVPSWVPDSALPDQALGFRVQNYGLTQWADLFTKRQATALSTFCALIDEVRAVVFAEAKPGAFGGEDSRTLEAGGRGASAYADAIAVMLACAISRSADFGASLCMWSPAPKNEVVMHVFGRQTLSMTWDFAEVNPFSESSGNWLGAVEWVVKALERVPAEGVSVVEQANAMQAGLLRSSGTRAILSCDPPYFDNVPYADLSDFFYVWQRRALRNVLPSLTSTLLVPKADELIAEPARHGGREGAEQFFLAGMRRALSAFAEDSDPNFPAAIYYAFKQTEESACGASSTGWETFLDAVVSSGFEVVGTWPVRTERPGRLRDTGSNALASSIVLVCRRRSPEASAVTRAEFRRRLRSELPAALKALQHGNIAPVDVAQAAIGPGMRIFSSHEKVVEADGSAMPVKDALSLISEALDEFLASHEGDLDPDSRFAITWFEAHGWNAGGYDEAEKVARTRNISVQGVEKTGIVSAAAGKVRLIKRAQLPANWDPATDDRLTVWEATQHLIKRLDAEGEQSAAALLRRLGPLADQARALAYRLYSTCLKNGWSEDALAFDGLVRAWPELEKLGAAPPVALAGQMGLDLVTDVEAPGRSKRAKRATTNGA